MDNLKPQMQRQMAGLENGAHTHGKGLFAGVALAETGTSGFAVEAPNALRFPAVWADRSIRPKPRLDVFEGSGFGLELGARKYGSSHVVP
jgi:hypothetical protein